MRKAFLNNFQTKVTLIFVFSLLTLGFIGSFFLYEYSFNAQIRHLKDKLEIISAITALGIDADALLKVPLNKEGVNSAEYKNIAEKVERVKEIDPSIAYIYTMKPTDVPGTWQFIVDPRPTQQGTRNAIVSAFPGDKYDASRFPAMLRAYEGQITTDEELVADEWGNTLSGYAPIYNSAGKVVAIVGADIDASSVYTIQQTVKQRVIFILLLGIFISIIAGVIISKGVTKPIEKLTQGTRKIAAGDLGYKVEIKSKDEIGELAAAFNKMAANLSESREKLYDYFYRVVQAMVRSLEAKDHYTRGHSDRVSEYAGKIAIEMGIASDKVDLLKKAAELHDIGKLGIHEDVLNKTSSLSDKEWDAVHEHPAVGEEILKPVFLDTEMLSVVRSHHERFDGKGYPDGLKGEQISIFAQITCVADAYDAMTSSRSYRPALSKEEAINRLKQGVNTQFNPKVVEAFIRVLKSE